MREKLRRNKSRSDGIEMEYEWLFRSYHSVMLAAAYNRLNDLGDADEVVAEVFAAAWRRRTEVGVLTLPWLYSTLRNHVGNEYRRRSRWLQREQRLLGTQVTEANLPPPTEENIELRRLITQLEIGDRELIWMAYWEDLTGAEIAEILGCTHSTARVRLLRARKRLKALMQTGSIDARRGSHDI